MLFQIDATFIVQLINFAIFLAVLNVVFLRPVSKAIAERRAYIDSLSSDYEAAQGQADALRKQAAHVLAEARREAEAALSRSRNDAGNESAKLAAEYAARAQAIVEDAHATVEREVAAVRPQQDALVGELAASIAGKVFAETRG
jgi:F-type H+-transporting ATPase subunit b